MRYLTIFSTVLLLLFTFNDAPQAGEYSAPLYYFADGQLYYQSSERLGWMIIQPDRQDLVFDRILDQKHAWGEAYTFIVLGHIDDGTQNFTLTSIDWDDRVKTYIFPNAYLGHSHRYIYNERIVFSALLNLDLITGETPSHGAGIYEIYMGREAVFPIVDSGLNVIRRENGSYILPQVMDFYFCSYGYCIDTVVAPVEGGYMHFEAGRLTYWTQNQPDIELVIPDESFQDREGLYLRDKNRLYRLAVKGKVVNHVTTTNGDFSVYITEVERTHSKQYEEYPPQWIYVIQHQPLMVIETEKWGGVFEWQYPHMGFTSTPYYRLTSQGDITFTPDNRYVLLTGFSPQEGASVWKLDLHAPKRPPTLLVSGLSYKRLGDEYSLPQFRLINNAFFSLVIISFRGIEHRTYNLSGDLLSVKTTPDNPTFYIENGVLLMNNEITVQPVSGALEQQIITHYKPSDGNGFGLAVGYLDDGTENFTLSHIEEELGGFSLYTYHYPNSILGHLPLSSGNGLFYDNLDNYVWIGIMGEEGRETASIYFLEGLRDFPVATQLEYWYSEEYPTYWLLTLRAFDGHSLVVNHDLGSLGDVSFSYDIVTGNSTSLTHPPTYRPEP